MIAELFLSLATLSGSGDTHMVDQFETNSIQHAGRQYPYRLLIPIDKNADYPLVVFLHGAGERGTDNSSQMHHLPARFLTDQHLKKKTCYVLAMQCPQDDQWANYKSNTAHPASPRDPMIAVIQAIQEVAAGHRVDESRIYLTGLSMGGFGSWDLASRHPDWFAAVVPICGGGQPENAEKLAHVPIWAFHGTADAVVPEQASLKMIKAIRRAGGRPAYTSLEGVGHGSWHFAYGPHGAMEWMFAQQNPTPPDFGSLIEDEVISP
jgi:predicted peptidase